MGWAYNKPKSIFRSYSARDKALILTTSQEKTLMEMLKLFLEVYPGLIEEISGGDKEKILKTTNMKDILRQIEDGLLTTDHFVNRYKWQQQKRK